MNSDNMGSSTFAGPGAGRYPTANSVLSDLIRLSQGVAPVNAFPLEAPAEMQCDNDYKARFYVRVTVSDCMGIIRCVTVMCGCCVYVSLCECGMMLLCDVLLRCDCLR